MDIINLIHNVELSNLNLKKLNLNLDQNTHKMVVNSLRYLLMINGIRSVEINNFCSIHKNSIKSMEIRLLFYLKRHDGLKLSGLNSFSRQQIKYSVQLVIELINLESGT